MLIDVTTPKRVDHVSSQGYAWGYIGSCVPFVVCLASCFKCWKDWTIYGNVNDDFFCYYCFLVVWSYFTTIKNLSTKVLCRKKTHMRCKTVLNVYLKRLKNVRKEKKIFLFLLAFFFYIDGVYTIIDMATAYGTALGFESTSLLLALLLTQVVAFPFAILFGRLATKYNTSKLIVICILAYLGISIFAIFLTKQWQFWLLAVLVGMFQGGIQSLSRSYFTKIISLEKSGEYFGLMDVCGKGASFLGTTVVGVLSQATGQINLSLGALSVFFMLGIVFFRMSEKREG